MIACPKCAVEIQVPIPEAKLLLEDEPPASPKTSDLPATREWNPDLDGDHGEADERAWAATKELPERSVPAPKREAPPKPLFAPEEFAAPMPEQKEPPKPKPPASKPKPKPQPAPVEDDEEFELGKTDVETEELDLTPLVDVTMLLLIFFMITANFSKTKTIETPAPDRSGQNTRSIQSLDELALTSVTVRIDEVDAVTVDDEPVDLAELEEVLGDKLRTEHKNEVIIQSSPKSRHESLVFVHDAATGAGMQNIRLATIKSEE